MDFNVANITNNFSISIVKYPELVTGILEISQPGLDISAIPVGTRGIENVGAQHPNTSQRLKLPNKGSDPEIDDMNITFNMNEDFSNYFQIFDWLQDIKRSPKTYDELISDIIIFFYDINKNPIAKMINKDCFPSNLSELSLNNTVGEAEPLTFTANFTVNNIVKESL